MSVSAGRSASDALRIVGMEQDSAAASVCGSQSLIGRLRKQCQVERCARTDTTRAVARNHRTAAVCVEDRERMDVRARLGGRDRAGKSGSVVTAEIELR